MEHTKLAGLIEEASEAWKDYLSHVSEEYETLLQEEGFWSMSTHSQYSSTYRWHSLGSA